MLDLGKIQDEIHDHLIAFHIPEAHAFALSGLILAEVIHPLLVAERAAAEAAAYARAAQVLRMHAAALREIGQFYAASEFDNIATFITE